MKISIDDFKYFFNYSLLIFSNFFVIIATPQDKLIFLRYNSFANIIFGIFIYIIYLRYKKTKIDKYILSVLITTYIISLLFNNSLDILYFSYPLIILWSEFFCTKFNLLKERLIIRTFLLFFSLISFLYFDESFYLRFFFIIIVIAYLIFVNKNIINYDTKSLNLVNYTIINLSCYYIPLILITYLNNNMKIIYILYSGLIAILLRLADISVRNSLNNERKNIRSIVKFSSILVSISILVIGFYFNNFYLIILIIVPYIILINLNNIKPIQS